MALPDIALKPGQMMVSLVTSVDSGINGISMLSGAVLATYDNQMGYNVGDSVTFNKQKSLQFNQTGQYGIYSIVNQNDVFFKSILPP